MTDYYNQEPRVNRDRIEEAVQRALSSRRSPPGSARKIVGSVYNGGAIPTTVPAWFLTHPADFGCLEVEGGACSPTIDSTNTVPILVLGPHVPSVGDLLPARQIGGKWVTGSGGTPPNGCTLTVDTKWCSCVAPGTITVTVHSGTIVGPVVCSGTADGAGLFVCHIATAGTYVAAASTTAGGYLNTPATVVIVSAPAGSPCNPATVRTVIYPTQVTATGFWGSKVLSPTGGANLCESASSAFGYTGTVTGFSLPAACGCAATSMNIDFVFIPCGSFGQTQPWLIYCIDTYTQTVPPFQLCPGPDPHAPPQSFTSATGNLSGTGPLGSGTTGFPVNLTGSYGFVSANDPRAILYGCCVSGANSCPTGITVTQ